MHIYLRILASLNLPAAIEDVSGTELPSSVQEKAEHIKSVGGLDTLNKLFQDLPDALVRNQEILDEVRVFYPLEDLVCTLVYLLIQIKWENMLSMSV